MRPAALAPAAALFAAKLAEPMRARRRAGPSTGTAPMMRTLKTVARRKAAVGSVRLSAAEARERLMNGGTGQRTLATKAAFRPSRWITDLLPAGTGCLVVLPERRSFPQGRDGDQMHALAMNSVFDKEFGCSIQVRDRRRRLGAGDAANDLARTLSSRAERRVPQEAELHGLVQ